MDILANCRTSNHILARFSITLVINDVMLYLQQVLAYSNMHSEDPMDGVMHVTDFNNDDTTECLFTL